MSWAKYSLQVKQSAGNAKAQVATGNTLLTIAHALLSGPTAEYHDLGADWYEARTQHRRQVATHLRGLQRLGYKVTLEPVDEVA